MIPPDSEIYDVEQRIAARRAQLARDSRQAAQLATQKLSSPVALAAAAAMGFFAASAMAKRRRTPPHPERRKSDHVKAAKATGITGLLLSGAMWYVRAQWGSPAKLAQVLLEKFQKRKAPASPRGVTPAKARALRHVARP
jgi:hypothetical protein